MRHTDTVIIGGGQAGLAMSHCLSDRNVDHVVLERGRIAERWRSERWDSLRLLTPNWQSRLPGFRYDGPDPDGFMTMSGVIGYLERYAASFGAPVEDGATVRSVEPGGRGYLIDTDRGAWTTRCAVIATGYSDLPQVPAMAAALSGDILQIVPTRYRNPSQLPPGGVFIAGASATGIQLADEIQASGRQVTLAVGRHLRLPRRYRGRDILWWMDAMGIFDDTIEKVFDIDVSRNQPSLQLVGRPDHETLDLASLQDRGVRLAGRLVSADGRTVSLADDLIATVVAADAKLAGLLSRIDRFISSSGLEGRVDDATPFAPCWPRATAATPGTLDLRAEGIETVIWATGFRRSYPWLRVPVLDGHGEIRHRGGITPAPGLYTLGLHFQRRRKSAFLDGVGDDAQVLAEEIARSAAVSSYPGSRRPAPLRPPATQTPSDEAPRSVPLQPAYDVVVIGARCAGAATALLLARRGLRVLAIDRGTYGSDILSTHALMRGAVVQLHRWGVLDAIRTANTPVVRSVSFHYADEELPIPIKPGGGIDGLYAPRRTVIDRVLADAAVAAGADVRFGVRLVDLVRSDDGRVRGVVVEDRNGGSVTIEADFVIGADGQTSAVARLAGAATYHHGRHAAAVVYAYFEGIELEGYHWFFRPGVSAGAIQTNDGLSCVFATMPPRRFLDGVRGDVEAGHHRVLFETSPELAAAVKRARRATRFHGFAGQPGYLRQSWGPGWALVGDAGYFKDPITAHGISDALRDAEMLSRAVVQGTDAALAGYQAVRDDLSLGLLGISDDIASFAWDLPAVRERHHALSDEMRREVAWLSSLDAPAPAPVGG